jgi:hypothetical protein
VVLRETAPSRDALYGSTMVLRRRQIGETALLGESWESYVLHSMEGLACGVDFLHRRLACKKKGICASDTSQI